MKFYQIITLFVIMSCNPTSEDPPIDILHLTPIKTIDAINDTKYFKSIFDIDYFAQHFYFTLFNENKIIVTKDKFNLTYEIVAKGRGPNEFNYPTFTTLNDNYIVVNDDGNRRFNIYNKDLKYLTSHNYDGFVFSEMGITPDNRILFSTTENSNVVVLPISSHEDNTSLKVPIPEKYLNNYKFKDPHLFHIEERNDILYFISRSFPYIQCRSSRDFSNIATKSFDNHPFFKEYLANLSKSLEDRPDLENNSIDLVKDVAFSDTHMFLLCYKRYPKEFPKVDCNILVAINLRDLKVEKLYALTDTASSNVFKTICYYDNKIIAFNGITRYLDIFKIDGI